MWGTSWVLTLVYLPHEEAGHGGKGIDKDDSGSLQYSELSRKVDKLYYAFSNVFQNAY